MGQGALAWSFMGEGKLDLSCLGQGESLVRYAEEEVTWSCLMRKGRKFGRVWNRERELVCLAGGMRERM